jgi:hypothetical protein
MPLATFMVHLLRMVNQLDADRQRISQFSQEIR